MRFEVNVFDEARGAVRIGTSERDAMERSRGGRGQSRKKREDREEDELQRCQVRPADTSVAG